jgi:hypothetical protein
MSVRLHSNSLLVSEHKVCIISSPSNLQAHRNWFLAEFQQEMREAIPPVTELLKAPAWSVRENAIQCLAGLGAQGMHSLVPMELAETGF